MCELNLDFVCVISIAVAIEAVDIIFKCRARNFPEGPLDFGGKWFGRPVRVLVYVRT